MKHTILKQDNQSAILLEMNGRSSSSKRIKHIEQRFFYITDQVEKGLVKIEHEYTDKMWIDVMAKPKQGRPFKIDRAKLMGYPIDHTEESIEIRAEPHFNRRSVLGITYWDSQRNDP